MKYNTKNYRVEVSQAYQALFLSSFRPDRFIFKQAYRNSKDRYQPFSLSVLGILEARKSSQFGRYESLGIVKFLRGISSFSSRKKVNKFNVFDDWDFIRHGADGRTDGLRSLVIPRQERRDIMTFDGRTLGSVYFRSKKIEHVVRF